MWEVFEANNSTKNKTDTMLKFVGIEILEMTNELLKKNDESLTSFKWWEVTLNVSNDYKTFEAAKKYDIW